MTESQGEQVHRGLEDRIDAAFVWDRIARTVIFIGGISAIIFVISIFIFIAKEGLGFALFDLDKSVFFGSPAWRPTSEPLRSKTSSTSAREPRTSSFLWPLLFFSSRQRSFCFRPLP